MSKIKIECNEEQKQQIIEMLCNSDCSCSICPLAMECLKYTRWYEQCPDIWENEVDWIIK